ncbi:hypothetical protein ACLM5J_09730 [Nocardioides sp. Bht2]|uniref:hypothetical protein n=1 Tax=Nocardioides sp. Bht2 TaxID=3392297 RepID=UPI0039B5CB0E
MERLAVDTEFHERLTAAHGLGISDKRLLGWEPIEVHEHEYDEAGRMVRTVVTREAEWTDAERSKMLALAQFDREVCDCGLHRSIADADPHLEMQERVCPVCAASAKNYRLIEDRDEKAMKAHGDKPAPGITRPGDGRRLYLRPADGPLRSDLPENG